jgi:ribokinase
MLNRFNLIIVNKNKNMTKFDVVTIGSAIKDVMFYSDEISVIKNKKDLLRQAMFAVEYGAKIEVDKVYVNYGGGALNVGVGLHNFGLKVAPMINLGKDWVGQEIYYFMKEQGLKTPLVQIDHKHPTGFSVILTAAKDKEHTIFTYKGSSCFLKLPPTLDRVDTEWYYVAPLSIEKWDEEFIKVIEQVKPAKSEVKIMWNPGSKQLKDFIKMKKFLPYVEVLMMNKDEATELVMNVYGRKVDKKKINQSRYLLDLLKKLGVKNLVITDGPKGAYGIDRRGKYYFKKSAAKKIVDTVGAGDAFGSGFLASFQHHHDFDKALTMGIKNSAGVLTEIGAQNGLLKGKF